MLAAALRLGSWLGRRSEPGVLAEAGWAAACEASSEALGGPGDSAWEEGTRKLPYMKQISRKVLLGGTANSLQYSVINHEGFPAGPAVKNCLPAQEMCLIPGSGRSLGGGSGSPLQYSCLGNPMGRGAWWAAVHGVAKSSDLTYRLNNSNNKP